LWATVVLALVAFGPSWWRWASSKEWHLGGIHIVDPKPTLQEHEHFVATTGHAVLALIWVITSFDQLRTGEAESTSASEKKRNRDRHRTIGYIAVLALSMMLSLIPWLRHPSIHSCWPLFGISWDEIMASSNVLSLLRHLFLGVTALRKPWVKAHVKDRQKHKGSMVRVVRSSFVPAMLRVFIFVQMFTWVPLARYLEGSFKDDSAPFPGLAITRGEWLLCKEIAYLMLFIHSSAKSLGLRPLKGVADTGSLPYRLLCLPVAVRAVAYLVLIGRSGGETCEVYL